MLVDVLLVFAVIFILYQLYSVLGHAPADDRATPSPKPKVATPPIITPENEIRKAVPNFDTQAFLQGASNAFSHIVHNFIKGDSAALKPWLEARLWQQYKKDIENRSQEQLTYDLAFFRHISTHLTKVFVKNKKIFVHVTFKSEQTLLLYKKKTLLEGDPDVSEILEDTWIFSHELHTENSIWRLHKTLDE